MKNRIVAWCDRWSVSFGRTTLALGIAMSTVGFSMQLLKNYREDACGIHWALIILPLLIYGVRIPYSISKRAWHMIPSDAIGLSASILLLAQFFYYEM